MKSVLFILTTTFLFILPGCKTENSKTEEEKTFTKEEIETLALEHGEEIANATQKTLGSKLQSEIKSYGIPQALKFCNVNAYPLTDSLKDKYNAEIKRATIQVRNPEDAATKFETQVINKYLDDINKGITPKPEIHIMDESIVFTKPIILNNDVCLKCHGEIGKNIKTEDYRLIKTLYPDDNATGHKLGDMRGIWSIKFHIDSLKKASL